MFFMKTWLFSCRVGLLLIVFICVLKPAKAQSLQDLETWTSFSAQYKTSSEWSVNFSQQFRLAQISTQWDRVFSELEVGKRLGDRWKTNVGFRHMWVNDRVGKVQGTERHYRFHMDVSYGFEYKRLEVATRLRYQLRNELGLDEADGTYIEKNYRFKSAWTYDFKDFKKDPVFIYELFCRSQTGVLDGFTKYRLGLEFKWKSGKNGRWKVGYIREKELFFWEPKTVHILRLNYRINVRRGPE